MATSLKARPAELTDAGDIAGIYNQGIEDRTATFETTPRTAEAVRGLLRARGDRYPAVVVEDGSRVLGFAWTSEYRPRSAYTGVASGSWCRASFWRTWRAADSVQRSAFARSASIAGTANLTVSGWTA